MNAYILNVCITKFPKMDIYKMKLVMVMVVVVVIIIIRRHREEQKKNISRPPCVIFKIGSSIFFVEKIHDGYPMKMMCMMIIIIMMNVFGCIFRRLFFSARQAWNDFIFVVVVVWYIFFLFLLIIFSFYFNIWIVIKNNHWMNYFFVNFQLFFLLLFDWWF